MEECDKPVQYKNLHGCKELHTAGVNVCGNSYILRNVWVKWLGVVGCVVCAVAKSWLLKGALLSLCLPQVAPIPSIACARRGQSQVTPRWVFGSRGPIQNPLDCLTASTGSTLKGERPNPRSQFWWKRGFNKLGFEWNNWWRQNLWFEWWLVPNTKISRFC
jgi:hypothetical protein